MNTDSRIIVGIDEAGRGPVIGPLVICAYAIKHEKITDLKKIGVRDSKTLSRKQRQRMYYEIKTIAEDIKVKHLSPAEIDELRKVYSLNIIEQKIMLKLAKDLSITPSEIYIDAADVNEKRFGHIFEMEFPNAKIISKHKADQRYSVVSAASIIAKVERDQEIDELKEKIGEDFGSGYPADPKTKSFLRNIYRKTKKFPPFVRESWDTIDKIKKELSEARKLTDFME